MKILSQCNILILTFLSLIIGTFPFAVYAKEINLFEQPRSDAKIMGKVDLADGIIPIYTPQDQKGDQWIKIADPRNGNTGWVKSKDLDTTGSFQSTVTFSQSTGEGGKPSGGYQVIQFGQRNNLTEEQKKDMIKDMQLKQQKFYESVQKYMDGTMRNMNYIFNNDGFMRDPAIAPVIIVPVHRPHDVPKPHIKTPPLAQQDLKK
jgi:hypothetical protein